MRIHVYYVKKLNITFCKLHDFDYYLVENFYKEMLTYDLQDSFGRKYFVYKFGELTIIPKLTSDYFCNW